MGDVDRDAIRACDDPDALLELRLELIAANTVPWRRAVALTIGVWGIVTGILIINMVELGGDHRCAGGPCCTFRARRREPEARSRPRDTDRGVGRHDQLPTAAARDQGLNWYGSAH